jgi:hypothetical protein
VLDLAQEPADAPRRFFAVLIKGAPGVRSTTGKGYGLGLPMNKGGTSAVAIALEGAAEVGGEVMS